mmetsp:Transcript_9915/g.36846  ORF Transcript_9915/g.36846 Transcript_9915/m.36846 type:complete len:225 (-) Transcript_9915:44-718(-)
MRRRYPPRRPTRSRRRLRSFSDSNGRSFKSLSRRSNARGFTTRLPGLPPALRSGRKARNISCHGTRTRNSSFRSSVIRRNRRVSHPSTSTTRNKQLPTDSRRTRAPGQTPHPKPKTTVRPSRSRVIQTPTRTATTPYPGQTRVTTLGTTTPPFPGTRVSKRGKGNASARRTGRGEWRRTKRRRRDWKEVKQTQKAGDCERLDNKDYSYNHQSTTGTTSTTTNKD